MIVISTSSMPNRPARRGGAFRRAFSLIEVLLAIFILGIGMIMVASVFPVGARWTQQTTEGSMGQVVAQTALSVINTHYGPGGDLRSNLAPDFFDATQTATDATFTPKGTNSILQAKFLVSPFLTISPFVLQPLPAFNSISPNERAYQFTRSNSYPAVSQAAFPVADPSVCTYFWTALARLSPSHRDVSGTGVNGIALTSSYKYDIYILVYHKGWNDQQFTLSPPGAISEVPYTRFAPLPFASSVPYMPSVFYNLYGPGVPTGTLPPIAGAVPQIGEYGIGAVSGTVFRQATTSGASPVGFPRPPIAVQGSPEPIIYSPPADGTSSSPLVYVYQTTLSY